MREHIRDLRFKLETLLFAWEGLEAFQEYFNEPRVEYPEIITFLKESTLKVEAFIEAMHGEREGIINRRGDEDSKRQWEIIKQYGLADARLFGLLDAQNECQDSQEAAQV